MQKVDLPTSFTKLNENCGLPDIVTDYQIRHLGNPSGLPEILLKIDPCLHIGPGNTSMNYEMGGTILSKTRKEKDLGVTMNANMKVSEQCRLAASKGNQVLGMIRRNITYKEKSLIVPMYKAIVRPHLEYCIQAWSPYLRKDIDLLEKYRGEQLNSFQN